MPGATLATFDPVNLAPFFARQVQRSRRSNVALVPSQPVVDLFLDPETTNMKLVARYRCIRNLPARKVFIGLSRRGGRHLHRRAGSIEFRCSNPTILRGAIS